MTDQVYHWQTPGIRTSKSICGISAGDRVAGWEVLGCPFAVGGHWKVVAQCDCGRIRIVQCHSMSSGRSRECKSCAATRSLTVHGDHRTALHGLWSKIKYRCDNPKSTGYHNYGGRGIGMCEEWRRDYLAFKSWAIENGYAPGLEIDRIDNDGDYGPSNCRFVTTAANNRNKRTNHLVTAFGVTKCVTDWVADHRCVCSRVALMDRLRKGWEPERAITTRPMSRNKWTKKKSTSGTTE